jgi:carboxymethylenebutenolidase
MKERIVEIATADGKMKTFITHPEQEGPFRAVVLYMDVWGVREELYDLARRIGTAGYYCMVPNLYYRQGDVGLTFRDANNRMLSLALLDEGRRQQVLAMGEKLTDAMVVEDTRAILKFIDGGEPVCPGAMGSIGYCMGGRHVFRVAGAFPDRFRASASLHGTNLVTDAPDSPHTEAKKFRGEVYCGFAEHDPYAPPATIKELDRVMKDCEARYSYAVHEGARHGYALPDRDIYHKPGATRDWELIFAMFRRQLPPCA